MLLWKFPANGEVIRLAIGRDGVVYASTWTGTEIYALASDGTLVRKFAPPEPAAGELAANPSNYLISQLIAATDRAIYTQSNNGDVCAFRSDGALKWKLNGIGRVLAAGIDGTLYAGCGPGQNGVKLCAFAPDGTLKWKFGQFEFTDLAIGSDTMIYASSGFGVYAFAPSGAVEWSFGVSRPSISYSWLAAGLHSTIYAVTANDIYVFARDGAVMSKTHSETPLGVLNDRHLAERDGIIYLGSYYVREVRDPATGARRFVPPRPGEPRYRVVAIDSHTGSLVWSFDRLRGKVFALVVGRDGTIDVGSYDGHVYGLDAKTGALKWRFWTGGAWGEMPVYALAVGKGGTIYLGTGSFVEAIRPR